MATNVDFTKPLRGYIPEGYFFGNRFLDLRLMRPLAGGNGFQLQGM